MNAREVTKLVWFVNTQDQRQRTDDVAVAGWATTLSQEAADMDYAWAERFVIKHYVKTDQMITVGQVARGWQAAQKAEIDRRFHELMSGGQPEIASDEVRQAAIAQMRRIVGGVGRSVDDV